jgi:endonuclease/exonuclease/phosphatase (EEP) superfamily protein YafD
MGISFLYRQYANAATGSMIGANALPLEAYVKHSPDHEPITLTPKATTFAKYDIEGHRADLLVISIHGINFETTGAFRRQLRQIESVILEHRGPVFLAGDFNTWNEARTAHLLVMARRLALTEATYINGHERLMFNGWALDHVFTRGLTVRSATVDGAAVGSDHRPILVDFEVTPELRLRR